MPLRLQNHPNRRIFIIQIQCTFRISRECAESRTFSKIENMTSLDFHLLIPICAVRDPSKLQ